MPKAGRVAKGMRRIQDLVGHEKPAGAVPCRDAPLALMCRVVPWSDPTVSSVRDAPNRARPEG
jgi:hypothetical protein